MTIPVWMLVGFVCFVQTNTVTSVRFGFFFVQIVRFLWLTAILLTKVGGSA